MAEGATGQQVEGVATRQLSQSGLRFQIRRWDKKESQGARQDAIEREAKIGTRLTAGR